MRISPASSGTLHAGGQSHYGIAHGAVRPAAPRRPGFVAGGLRRFPAGTVRSPDHHPKEALGFNLGDDYQMAGYTQLEKYWKQLD